MSITKFEQKYLKLEAVLERYQISKTTVWRWAAEGKFPKPKKFSRTTRWAIADLEQWEVKEGYEASEFDDAG